MFKLMVLMKRKHGTSMQDLIDYYENHHSRLGVKAWRKTGLAPKRYRRRYLHPFPAAPQDFVGGTSGEPVYDVAMEMWFDSREDCDRLMAAAGPEIANEFIEDELRFLDRDKTAFFIIEDHETDLVADMAEGIVR